MAGHSLLARTTCSGWAVCAVAPRRSPHDAGHHQRDGAVEYRQEMADPSQGSPKYTPLEPRRSSGNGRTRSGGAKVGEKVDHRVSRTEMFVAKMPRRTTEEHAAARHNVVPEVNSADAYAASAADIARSLPRNMTATKATAGIASSQGAANAATATPHCCWPLFCSQVPSCYRRPQGPSCRSGYGVASESRPADRDSRPASTTPTPSSSGQPRTSVGGYGSFAAGPCRCVVLTIPLPWHAPPRHRLLVIVAIIPGTTWPGPVTAPPPMPPPLPIPPPLSRHKGWGCQPGAWRTLKALKTLILKLKKEKKERKLKKERVLAD